jgi:hypothetical protein
MKKLMLLTVVAVLAMASTGFALEKTPVMESVPAHDYSLSQSCSIIYYNGCRWLWVWSGWAAEDMTGVAYDITEEPTCDQTPSCETLDSGYEYFYTAFPGYGFDGEFMVFDAAGGCVVGDPVASVYADPTRGWNFFDFFPDICLTPFLPDFIVLWHWIGGTYPTYTLDNEYHDLLDPANCPGWIKRSMQHCFWFGTVGTSFPLCPPSPLQAVTGYYDEAIQDIFILCDGPTATDATSWGGVKAMFK